MVGRACVAAGLALGVGVLPAPASAAPVTPTQLRQLDLAAHPAVKLLVRQTGWLRVTQPELLAAGLDPKVDVGTLQLFADGVERPLQVTGNGDAVFDADEAIELYAEARDSLWTDTRGLLAG